MGNVLVRVRVLPDDVNIQLDNLAEKVKAALPQDAIILKRSQEPIAFGLSALTLDIKIGDSEGSLEKVESSISSVEHVSRVDVIGASRLSTSI